MTRSGAPKSYLPKCKYFNQLQFIHDKVTNKQTDSNLLNILPTILTEKNMNFAVPSPAESNFSLSAEMSPQSSSDNMEIISQPIVNLESIQKTKR